MPTEILYTLIYVQCVSMPEFTVFTGCCSSRVKCVTMGWLPSGDETAHGRELIHTLRVAPRRLRVELCAL